MQMSHLPEYGYYHAYCTPHCGISPVNHRAVEYGGVKNVVSRPTLFEDPYVFNQVLKANSSPSQIYSLPTAFPVSTFTLTSRAGILS